MAHDGKLFAVSAALHEDPKMVVVENESFAAFDLRMDQQLDELVALWIHAAAPNASRLGRTRKDFGR
jgi:hypothetical protein